MARLISGKTTSKKNIENKRVKQIVYSYVSLFGLCSISDLKEKILYSGRITKDKNEVKKKLEESSSKKEKIVDVLLENSSKGWKLSHALIPLLKLIKLLPMAKEFSAIFSLLEHSLIDNYLICIDDLERKESTLTMTQLMGVVDELGKRKSCKIILILNDKTLSKQDLIDFNKYREKIVDLEIEYQPTTKENILKVFDSSHCFIEDFSEIFQTLNTSNIRIIKKFKWGIYKIESFIKDIEYSLQKQIFTRFAIFCWSFYDSENSLSLEDVIKEINNKEWILNPLKNENEDLSDEVKKWRGIASHFGLFPLEFDDHLVSMVTKGYLNKKSFRQVLEKKNQDEQASNARKKIHEAWDTYRGSFGDIEDVKEELKKLLDGDLSKISLSNFSQSIDLLEEFGVGILDYIEKYIKANKELFLSVEEYPYFKFFEIKNPQLKDRIENLRNVPRKFDIDEVLNNVSKNEGWDPKELDFLDSLSEDKIFEWMLSNPDSLPRKIKRGLLLFEDVSSNKEEQQKVFDAIVEKTKSALIRVGKKSPHDKRRVEIFYGLEIPES